jgi:anti-sigma factor RsiW
MKCKNIHSKLIFFIEGDLSENEMKEVALHLLECKECAAFVETMKKILIRAEQERPAGEDPYFFIRLKARMEKQGEIAASYNSLWRNVLQPVFFSFIVFAGIYAGIYMGKLSFTGTDASVNDVFLFLNEMKEEPLENFLME